MKNREAVCRNVKYVALSSCVDKVGASKLASTANHGSFLPWSAQTSYAADNFKQVTYLTEDVLDVVVMF